MRHFRQVLAGIDVAPLLRQIEANPGLWNYDDSWTRNKPLDVAVAGVDTIVLRYNHPTPIGQPQRWDKPAFGILTAAQPIILDVMRAIPGEHLGKVLITRLRPGQEIIPHTHVMAIRTNSGVPQVLPHYYRRYQIPLSVAPGAVFRCGDEELHMQPGTAWSFDDISPALKHSVFNGSPVDRISMLADIRPFGL